MSKFTIIGIIASSIIIAGGVYLVYGLQNAPEQKINTGQCLNDCFNARDICLAQNNVEAIQCDIDCKNSITNSWIFDYDSCVREAEWKLKECKSSPFINVDECNKSSTQNLQYCKDKKIEVDNCTKPCADAKQKRYDKCMEDFNQCADKCPSECETNEDCNERSGNSCAIGTCAEVDMGRESGLKRKLCSYNYKSPGTCCPGASGPNTCTLSGLSETTCTGEPCKNKDDDNISVIEKEPIKIDLSKSPTIDSAYGKICDSQHHQFSFQITPRDLAGQTITGIEVDLSTREFSIPMVTMGNVNLNGIGFYKADWQCPTTSSIFRCFGKNKLIEGEKSTIVLNFSSASAIANPPPYLNVKLLDDSEASVVKMGVEFKIE